MAKSNVLIIEITIKLKEPGSNLAFPEYILIFDQKLKQEEP